MISPFASILQLKSCVFSSLVAMDQVELLRQWSQATIENAALKAEVAGLKARLTDAHDKIASLQQFLEGEAHMRRTAQAALEAANSAADCALKAQESTRSMLEHFQGEAETFRKELMRRGADDPRKPKPPCETALAALNLVRDWDRDECVVDLQKQRTELLRKIAALKSGKELKIGDVMAALEEDTEFPKGTLLHALRLLREQISSIWMETIHWDQTWDESPLSLFRPHPEEEEDESMDEDGSEED